MKIKLLNYIIFKGMIKNDKYIKIIYNNIHDRNIINVYNIEIFN